MAIEIDLSKVYRKLSNANMQAGQRALANQALADMNENFVPMLNGDLRDSASIATDGSSLYWNIVYARKHYYTDFSPNYSAPGTGPYWDLKAKGIFMSDWVNAFVKGAKW